MKIHRMVYNFHSVDKVDPHGNPFARLSNIRPGSFNAFTGWLGRTSRFSVLEELLSNSADSGSGSTAVHFTFDDLSTSFVRNVLPLIEKKSIPVTLFVSARNAESGYSWRDKIYFILDDPKLKSRFVSRMQDVFACDPFDTGRIYWESKDPKYDQSILESDVVDVVLKDYMPDFLESVDRFKPYLTWEDLEKIKDHPLITIGNHGHYHYDYRSLSNEQISEDIQGGHLLIQERLGITCDRFAIPFGGMDEEVKTVVTETLSRLRYKSAGWVRKSRIDVDKSEGIAHYFRIDAGKNVFLNLIKFWSVYLKSENK
ncbi:polysaccharide deacetylase family protein [Acidobacteriota bacterium]